MRTTALYLGRLNPLSGSDAPSESVNSAAQKYLTPSYTQQSSNQQRRNEDDTKVMGVNALDLDAGLLGQNMASNARMNQIENDIAKVKNEAKDKILSAKTPSETEVITTEMANKLSELKAQALELKLLNADFKIDKQTYNNDVEYVSKSSGDAPAIMTDFGALTSTEQSYKDGTNVAAINLFRKGNNLIATTSDKEGNEYPLTMNDYLYQSNETPSLGRYKSFVKPMSAKDYDANIRGRLSGLGTISGDSIQLINDGGPAYAEDLVAIAKGQGYKKTHTSSNVRALNSAISNMYNNSTPEERNYALSKLVTSGEVPPPITVSYKGKNTSFKETITASNYSDLSIQLDKTREKWSKETDQEKKEFLFKQGIAISDAMINGVKARIIGDAFGYYEKNRSVNSSFSLHGSSESRNKKVEETSGLRRMTSYEALFNSAFMEANKNKTTNYLQFFTEENGKTTLFKFPSAQKTTTSTTKGQLDYLKDLGYDIKDPKQPRPSILDVTSKFIFAGKPIDTRNLSTEELELFRSAKVEDASPIIYRMHPIKGNSFDVNQSPQTYLSYEVELPRLFINKYRIGLESKESIPVKKWVEENGKKVLKSVDTEMYVRYDNDKKKSKSVGDFIEKYRGAYDIYTRKDENGILRYYGRFKVPVSNEAGMTRRASEENAIKAGNVIMQDAQEKYNSSLINNDDIVD